jgi:hypothetical protein
MILDSTTETRRALASFGVLSLLGVVVVTIAVPPASGYEYSIYESFPWFYWALVIGAIAAGSLTILASAFADRTSDRFWIIGVATVVLTNLVLLFMPYIRGYPMYGRADPMTHLGYIHIITDTGVVGGGNIYPNTHLLIQILSYATGQEAMSVINIVPIVVTLLYFGSMAMLLKCTYVSRRHLLAGLPLALLPVYGLAHHGTSPYRLTILIIPFVLYLVAKEQRMGLMRMRGALVISLIATVIYHPLATVFLLIVFVLHLAIRQFRRFGIEQAKPTNIVSLVTVVFAAWYFNFAGIIFRFEGIVEEFLVRDNDAPIDSYSNTLATTSPELTDVVRIATFKYGTSGLIVGLGVAFLVVALYLWWQDEYRPNIFTTVFSISLIGFAIGSAAFLFFDLIVPMDRPLQFAKIFGIVLASGLLYLTSKHKIVPEPSYTVLVVVVLLLTASLTTMSLYESQLSSEFNPQVTEMELDGSQWVFENRNGDRKIEEFGIRQYRFHDAMYGVTARDAVRREGTTPPAHFNYSARPHFGMNYDEDVYLILTRLGRITYPKKFPDYREFWAFTPQDFARLEEDPTVNRVYDNGEFTTYGVDSTQLNANETAMNASTPMTNLSMEAPLGDNKAVTTMSVAEASRATS